MQPEADSTLSAGTTSRRHFLNALAGAAIAGMAAPVAWAGTRQALAAGPPAPGLRLAFSSVMLAELPIEEVCQRAAALGFEALDLWCPFAKCKHLDDVEQRLGPEGLKAVLQKTKLKLCSFTVYKLGFPRYAPFIKNFGGGLVVRESQYGKFKPEEITAQMRSFFEQLKPEIELAAQSKVRLAIENHSGALLNSMDSFKAFMDLNPAPGQVGIALAPYHLQRINLPVEDVIAICGQQLWFFYAWQNAKALEQLPAHGPADFKFWLAALAKVNYQGYVNPFMHGEPEVAELSAALMKSRDYLRDCWAKVGKSA